MSTHDLEALRFPRPARRLPGGIVLALAVALAGCNQQQPGETVLEQEAKAVADAQSLAGANRLFGFPAETIAAINQFGYRLGSYSGATLNGNPILLSQSDRPQPNRGTVTVAGPGADRIDQIVFTLTLTDPQFAAVARQRQADVLRGVLFQFKIEDRDKLLDAVTQGRAAQGEIDGVATRIAVQSQGDVPRITVTFTPGAAKAPDIQPDQGQADGNRA